MEERNILDVDFEVEQLEVQEITPDASSSTSFGGNCVVCW